MGGARRRLVSSTGNVADLGILGSLGHTSGNPPAIAFNADGSLLAVWHDSIGLEIWDTRTGESLAVLNGRNTTPAGTLTSLAGSGDLDEAFKHRTSLNFDAGRDTLRVGDVGDFAQVVNGIPTGQHTGTFRTATWSLRPTDQVRAACAIAGRDLTHREWRLYVSSTTPYHQTCTPLLRAR